MAPSCKFKLSVWEHFAFSVRHFVMFVVEKIYKFTLWVYTCFGFEIQTVIQYSCLNWTEITENRHKKSKPNRNKSEPWQPYSNTVSGQYSCFSVYIHVHLMFLTLKSAINHGISKVFFFKLLTLNLNQEQKFSPMFALL